MKISSISDIHLSPHHPERFQLFYSFCKSKEVIDSDLVILLGDIFDAMTGNKAQYSKKYQQFFEALGELLEKDKKIMIVEGNHDFHTDKIYGNYFKKFHPQKTHNYTHINQDTIIKSFGKNIYVGHGDILDYKNEAYKKWKKIYTSGWFRYLISYVFPFWLIEFLGNRASKNSKKRSRDSFNIDESRKLYRDGFKDLIKNQTIDIALTGHTHIEENIIINEKRLLNNGFFPATKSFIYISENDQKLVTLTES